MQSICLNIAQSHKAISQPFSYSEIIQRLTSIIFSISFGFYISFPKHVKAYGAP